MRILKYIFLLIVLVLIACTVFVATQKGQFEITKTKIIKSPRNTIFNYVNDYRNWENWSSWNEENTKFKYPGTTSGKGASYSWESDDSEGMIQTIYLKDNDSISQKMTYNGSPSVLSWKFKDTVGGTKVTWRAKGKLDFISKIYAAANGGAGTIFSEMFDKSLAKLDKTLDYEINTYNVKVHGITQKTGVMYLRQTINSTIANEPKNARILLNNMVKFFRKNKIPTYGKPFMIYHTYDFSAGLTRISACMPIREEIYTSAGSDMTFGKFEAFRALKVTLTGDYSHRSKAWQKAAEYLTENKIERLPDFRTVEIFTKNIEDTKSPSQWITDIYIPIRSGAAPAPTPAVRRAATVTTPRVQPVESAPVEPAAPAAEN